MDLEFKKGCSFEFNKHNLFLFNFQNIGFIDDLLMSFYDLQMFNQEYDGTSINRTGTC